MPHRPRTPFAAALLALTLPALTLPALAQTPDQPQHPHPPTTTHTFFLTNAAEAHETNEINTAIRNMLDPSTRVYFLPSENAIVVGGTQDQIDLAAHLLAELDRPRKSYRLIYTLTTLDNGQRTGTEHFSMIVVTGQRATLKQGSKIPLATGSFKPESGATETQYTYLDIGMNFDATLDEFSSGVRLRSKVEQSSVVPEQSPIGATDPIVRQTVLEGTSILTPNKPLILGSLDIPGSTRHIDITVTMEPAT